jgi:diguanylate cyclase (GGDEF)-like protein/PAS domain S-box-containing protein
MITVKITKPAGTFILIALLLCLSPVLLFLLPETWPDGCIIAVSALPLAGALAALHLFFRGARRTFREYEENKSRLFRQTLLAKRKSRLADYFDRVLRDAADIIFTLDIDGYVLKFNTGAESILGFRQHEIVGKPFNDLLVEPVDSTRIFDQLLQEDRVQNLETRMKAKDGQVVDISLSISEMRDEKNRILGMVATCKDVTDKKALEHQLIEKNALLAELAITDNLSGLYNVRHFHAEMGKAFTRLKRKFYSAMCLLMIDIDKFKELNDTQGHPAGDVVIEKLGDIIKACIRRDVDSGYRYGGDEFVVLLLETDADNAGVVAKRIIDRFNEYKFGQTSLSIGIASAGKEDDEEALVQRADTAMYQAKRAGGDRVQIFKGE